MEASSCRYDQLTPFPSPSIHSWGGVGGSEYSKLLNRFWSLLWPAPIQKPPRVASLEQKMLLVLWLLKNLKNANGSLIKQRFYLGIGEEFQFGKSKLTWTTGKSEGAKGRLVFIRFWGEIEADWCECKFTGETKSLKLYFLTGFSLANHSPLLR